MKLWTQEEDDILRAGYRDKVPLPEIAAKLNRPENGVRNRAYALRLNPQADKKQTSAELIQVAAMAQKALRGYEV